MRKVIATYMTQNGQTKEIFMPTNGRNVVDNLTRGRIYTLVYKLGERSAIVSGIYEDHTDYYKSLLFRDLSRKNKSDEFVQMAIPTENIHEVHVGIEF